MEWRPGPTVVSRAAHATMRGLTTLSCAGLAVYALYSMTGVGGARVDSLFEDWLFNALLIAATFICLLRGALVRSERAPWLILGFGLACWSAGEVLLTVWPAQLEGGAFPSVSDLLWLAFYPAAYAAVLLLVRARSQRFYMSSWLDGIVGSLAVSALAVAFVFPTLLSKSASSGHVIADLAYPVADLLLIVLVLGGLALTGWRPDRILGYVAAGLVLGAIADGLSLWWAASGHAPGRAAFDWLWPASTLLLARAGWQERRPVPTVIVTGWRAMACPVAFALIALSLRLSDLIRPAPVAAYMLASAALAFVILRMALTFAENLRMAERSHEEALTDVLTGLGNRRRLMIDLDETLATSSHRHPSTLVLFDLDGFKRYNDTFGHPAGDALLARLGGNLEAAIAPFGSVYRLGGDEFCALLTAESPAVKTIVASATDALSEEGSGFSVTTSVGCVAIPAEADDATLALQISDHRLYANKGTRGRPDETQEQTRNVLMQILHERQPDLYEHLDGVAGLARGVGRRLELTADELDEMARAAELHDVGKMAIPDEILNKPGKLDELERGLMEQHTLVGERILGAAPALRSVGKLVRFSHERFDGAGYPDGLAGEAIPIGARIIAVCDSFDAMTSNRPYKAAMGVEEAMAELRRCAGGQFDPRVVEAFCAELSSPPSTGAETRGAASLAGDREPVAAETEAA